MPHRASILEERVSSPAWKTDLHLSPRNQGTMDMPGESAAELPARWGWKQEFPAQKQWLQASKGCE